MKAIHASGGGTFTKKTPRAYEGDVVTLNNSSIQYKVDHVKDVADGHKEHHLVKIDIDTPTTSTSVTPDGYSPLSNFADLGNLRLITRFTEQQRELTRRTKPGTTLKTQLSTQELARRPKRLESH